MLTPRLARYSGAVRIALLVSALFSFGAVPASAEPESPEESSVAAAVTHYNRGIRFYQTDAFEAALLEFRRAYELAPHFRVLYNIAQVCFELKDYPCALRSFDAYLRDGADQISAERRSEVEKEIATLNTLVATVAIRSNVEGATVSVDDVVVGVSPLTEPVLVAAGRRRIAASKHQHLPASQLIDVPSGAHAEVALELSPLPSVPAAKTSAPVAPMFRPTTTQSRPRTRFTTWSWLGIGGASALGVTGAIMGVLALDANDEYKHSVYADERDGASQRDTAQSFALASDLLIGSGVVLLGTTLTLTLLSSPEQKVALQASVSPRAVTLGAEF